MVLFDIFPPLVLRLCKGTFRWDLGGGAGKLFITSSVLIISQRRLVLLMGPLWRPIRTPNGAVWRYITMIAKMSWYGTWSIEVLISFGLIKDRFSTLWISLRRTNVFFRRNIPIFSLWAVVTIRGGQMYLWGRPRRVQWSPHNMPPYMASIHGPTSIIMIF